MDGVWVGQSIRRCYRERTNDVRYGVITVQYFSLRPHFTFCHFPDWLQIVLWIPNQLFSLAWPLPPAPQMDRCSSLPCRGPVTRCASSLRDRALLARRTKIFGASSTHSKRPSNSTTLLLPNLIIIFDHRDHRSVDRPSPRSLFFPFLAVAVHISMSQTNQRYTSHRRGDSAAVNFFQRYLDTG